MRYIFPVVIKFLVLIWKGSSSVQSPAVDYEKVCQKFLLDMREKGLVVTTIAHAFDGLDRKQ